MAFQEILIYVLSFIVGLFISEVLADLILIEIGTPKGKRFKLAFNFGGLNPFINHDKAIFAYILEVVFIGIFTYYLQKVFSLLIITTFFYYIPIFSLVVTCIYILSIRKLQIIMNAKRWLIFTFLVILTAGLFFVFYWIRHPDMFETLKSAT